MTPAGIYVHWAFCPYICPYCDFAKWPFDARAAERYVSALEAEIARAPELAATTVFYGGGTPNANSEPQLVRVLDLVRERFGVRADAEISIEVNPDRELTGNLEQLRRSGFNRMSIGAQSFEAPELRVLGRRHSAADVEETVRRARAAGFGNVNVDLMFGAPGQNAAVLGAFARCGDCAWDRAHLHLRSDDRGGHAVRGLAGARAGRLRRRRA